MKMEIKKLQLLVKKLGRAKLAAKLNVSESTITGWLNRGLVSSGPGVLLLDQIYSEVFEQSDLVLLEFLKERLSGKKIYSLNQEIFEIEQILSVLKNLSEQELKILIKRV